MYLAWAAFYEGGTDAMYFDVLIPRLLEDILAADGIRPVDVPSSPAVKIGLETREVNAVAAEICGNREAFHLLFIHADTGGRALQAGIANRREAFAQAAVALCEWPINRTALLSPRHETEAWALADGEAVCRALGFNGRPAELGLPRTPAAAERLQDPKAKLDEAARIVSARGYRNGAAKLLPLIAQEQQIATLRNCPSFQDFEASLRDSLASLGCL